MNRSFTAQLCLAGGQGFSSWGRNQVLEAIARKSPDTRGADKEENYWISGLCEEISDPRWWRWFFYQREFSQGLFQWPAARNWSKSLWARCSYKDPLWEEERGNGEDCCWSRETVLNCNKQQFRDIWEFFPWYNHHCTGDFSCLWICSPWSLGG